MMRFCNSKNRRCGVFPNTLIISAAMVFLSGTCAAEVLWDDVFSASSLNANWTEFTQGGGAGSFQSGGQLIMDAGTTAGSAQAAVSTVSDQSGTVTQYNGEKLYNFYDHQVKARFEIASIIGTPGAGRNVFYFSIGDDAGGNHMPQPNALDDGVGFSLEQTSSGWRIVYEALAGEVSQSGSGSVANLSGRPICITYTLNSGFAEIKLEGTTVASLGTVGSGFVGGTILVVPLADLSANISEYRLAFGAYNRGTVAAATEVRLDGMQIEVPDLEGPGGPVAVQDGEFVVKKTGERFFPVGFNYIGLRYIPTGTGISHDTFSPYSYDSATVSNDLAEIAAGGFNTVRVFIENAANTNAVVVAPADETLSEAYMENVADFLEQAKANSLYVILTVNGIVWSRAYAPYYDSDSNANITGQNQFLLNPGYIAGKQKYMTDFIETLQTLAPGRVEDTVLAFDPLNECAFFTAEKPFSLSSGSVTPANGVTYDLATEKSLLADDMAIYWMNRMAEAVCRQAPGVLVDFNCFTYAAVNQSIGSFVINGGGWNDRYPFRPEAMAASEADFLDMHFYTADSAELQADLDSIEFPAASNAWAAVGKPMIIGEFGAMTNDLSFADAVSWKQSEINAFTSNGFQGCLFWTYKTDKQPWLWHAVDEDGSMLDMLVVSAAQNYFGYPPAEQDVDADGMPDNWEWAFFQSTNAPNGGPDEDFDGDGVGNRAEYIAGTDPNDASAYLAITDTFAVNDGLQIEWSASPWKTYRVLHSESLTAPLWSVVGDAVSAAGSSAGAIVPTDAESGFYKIRPNSWPDVSWDDDFSTLQAWEESFENSLLNAGWTEFTQGAGAGSLPGGGQLVMDTGVTNGSAQAAVSMTTDESGAVSTFRGHPLYNFYAHRVTARFDIASITGIPGGRNVFYFSIGDDAAGNYMPQQNVLDDGIGFTLEQVDTGSGPYWRIVYLALDGASASAGVVANISGVPSALTYVLDGTQADILLEGATITTVGGAGSGTVGGSSLTVTLADLSANISEYTMAFGAYNLGTVTEKTIVTLNAFSVEAAE